MAQGGGNFGKVFAMYAMLGGAAMLVRRGCGQQSMVDLVAEKLDSPEPGHGAFRRFLRTPFVPLTLFLLIGSMFLPRQPWKHMTSTLLYDVVGTVSSAIVTKSLRDMRGGGDGGRIGTNPLGSLHYSPTEDPYYISNLDQPLDPFIASALKGTQFTNVVHIVLESMRADSYPFDEQGMLMEYINNRFDPIENGTAVTTSNVTPFIQSLAEHTISWDTVWATIPFTHKAMLGRMFLPFCSDIRLLWTTRFTNRF